MSLILPTQVGTASSWALIDYASRSVRSDPAVGGLATIDLGQIGDTEMWLIDHAVVACNSATPTELRWYRSTVADQSLLDGTGTGNFDVGDWPNGLQLHPSESLIAQWTGAADGAVGIVAVQFRLLRR